MTNDLKHPSEHFLRSIDIHTLLPQQEPFIMVGTLVGIDECTTVCETTICPDGMFVDNGIFSAGGMIENIAQTCAARIGYINKYILKTGMQIGYIGAIKNLVVNALPKIGDVITTKIVVLEDVFGVMLADATITCDGRKLVTSEIKLVVQ